MKIYSTDMIKNKLRRRKKIEKAVCVALCVLAAFAVICAGTAFCRKFVFGNKSGGLFGYTPFIVLSGSMRPSLEVQDIVVVKNVSEDKISTGDVITFFDKDGSIVTHRVAEISEKDGKKYYVTKGDANNVADADSIAYEDIIGRYSFTIPKGGRVVAALTSPAAIVVFVLLCISICMVVIFVSRRKAARHSVRENYKKQYVV